MTKPPDRLRPYNIGLGHQVTGHHMPIPFVGERGLALLAGVCGHGAAIGKMTSLLWRKWIRRIAMNGNAFHFGTTFFVDGGHRR